MQWRGTAWRSVPHRTAWSTACFSVSVAGSRPRLLTSLLSSSSNLRSPPSSHGALTLGGPQAPGAAPLSAALCLAEDAAGRYISPFHDIPLYADAGEVRGSPGFGGRGWLWGGQRGCRAEGTLRKAVGAAPTLLLAVRRRRGGLPSRTAICWSSEADTVLQRSSEQENWGGAVLCRCYWSGAGWLQGCGAAHGLEGCTGTFLTWFVC